MYLLAALDTNIRTHGIYLTTHEDDENEQLWKSVRGTNLGNQRWEFDVSNGVPLYARWLQVSVKHPQRTQGAWGLQEMCGMLSE